MRKINLIFQEILKYILFFLFALVWFRYYLKSLWLAVFLSILTAGIVYGILFVLKRKKLLKNGLKIKEKEDAENMFFSLACQNNPIDFFAKLASKKHKNVTKYKHYIVVKHEENGVKTILWFDGAFDDFNISKFMEIYGKIKKENATKIVICCKEIKDKTLFSFSENFKEKFLFFDEYDTYQKLYKFYDCYPEITHQYKKTKKLVFKDFVAYSFNKKRTKGYLFSAFVLILSSLFIKTSVYYCIIASILVVFAIVSQFNNHFNVNDVEAL